MHLRGAQWVSKVWERRYPFFQPSHKFNKENPRKIYIKIFFVEPCHEEPSSFLIFEMNLSDLRTTYLKSCLPGVGTLKIEGFPWNSNSFTWKFGRIATKLLSHSETSNKWATKKTSKIPVYWLIATLKWGGDPLSLWMKVAEQSALIVYAQMQKTLWFMH